MNTLQMGQWRRVPGESAATEKLNELIQQVAPTDASVIITGESGTGKEVVAEVIHRLSRRSDAAFIALNCGAISPNLIESELFGHERGSFTGAVSHHTGHFARANGGTLFLDELTEMPTELQVKLLRVLETGRFIPVGSQDEQTSDVRILAATNRSPQEAIAQGLLREDLFYRLQVFPIHVPPLRERGEDVLLLAQYFLDQLNAEEDAKKYFTDAARATLLRYTWPGNVRQLRNVIRRAYIVSAMAIGSDQLQPELSAATVPASHCFTVQVGSSIADVERRLIMATLRSVDNNKTRAATILGVSVKTLYNRLRSYREQGLEDDDASQL